MNLRRKAGHYSVHSIFPSRTVRMAHQSRQLVIQWHLSARSSITTTDLHAYQAEAGEAVPQKILAKPSLRQAVCIRTLVSPQNVFKMVSWQIHTFPLWFLGTRVRLTLLGRCQTNKGSVSTFADQVNPRFAFPFTDCGPGKGWKQMCRHCLSSTMMSPLTLMQESLTKHQMGIGPDSIGSRVLLDSRARLLVHCVCFNRTARYANQFLGRDRRRGRTYTTIAIPRSR